MRSQGVSLDVHQPAEGQPVGCPMRQEQMKQEQSRIFRAWECHDVVSDVAPTSAVVKVSAAALDDKVLANLQGQAWHQRLDS